MRKRWSADDVRPGQSLLVEVAHKIRIIHKKKQIKKKQNDICSKATVYTPRWRIGEINEDVKSHPGVMYEW